MSVKYIVWAFDQAGLPHGPKFVLVALADIANDDGWAYPGTRKISEKVGMVRTTVSRHLRHLEELELISIEARTGQGGRQTSNGYQLWMTPPSQIETGVGSDVQVEHPPVSECDTPPSQNATGPVSECDTPPSQNATPPVSECDTPPSQNATPPVSECDTLNEPSSYPSPEPSSYPSNGTVKGRDETGAGAPAAALPPWFEYLLEIKGKTPVKRADWPKVRDWAGRKGYSYTLLEAVAEDLMAKWGTPQSAKRPWGYTDVRGTFQKWCRIEATLHGDVSAEPEPRRMIHGAITRGDSGIWARALERLEVQVTRPSFETWFKETVGLGYAENTLVVGVANETIGEMLEERMYGLCTKALRDLGAGDVEVAFRLKERVESETQ